jgi:formamidopyrimidine-DNA glycosylase
MPELPEVETIRLGLEPVLAGARLSRVEQRRPDLRFPLPHRFAQRLTGARVLRLGRRAKYLLAELDQGETWVTHLGMTGRFAVGQVTPGRFVHDAPQALAHEHLVFETDAGARIGFFDARRFGYMDLILTEALGGHAWFAGLGPEPLGNEFSAEILGQAFKGRTQNVKATLLDQRVVAGLGNIYVCEALHRSGISPETPAGALSRAKLEKLTATVREVLTEALVAGGSTLRDFANAEGGQGYFQHAFRVYGREGEPCAKPRCPGVVARMVQAGRSTFHCPKCQK